MADSYLAIENVEWGVECRGDLQVARGRPKGLPYIPKVAKHPQLRERGQP
jgi:hypothetical protein